MVFTLFYTKSSGGIVVSPFVWFVVAFSFGAVHRQMQRRLGFIAVYPQEAGIIRAAHGIVFTLSYVLHFLYHSSFGYLRAATASTQAAFSSRNSIQYSSRYSIQFTRSILRFTAVHREEFPFCIQRRIQHRRKQHSVHAIHSSHTAFSGTQQYIEEFPFAFKDEHDMAQEYIVIVSYVFADPT
jgi:hypothetical protein